MIHRRSLTPFSPNHVDAERDVALALECADDARLWQTLRGCPGEDSLLQLVAEEAPRLVHRQRSVPLFSELLLVPVVETDRGAVIGNSENWKGAEQCISEALQAWQGAGTKNTMFRGVLPYEWIASWEPSMLRRHLEAAAPAAGHQNLTFHPAPLLLPEGAPRLGFIVTAVTQAKAWPELPVPNTLRDARFRDVVANALASRDTASPEILPPDQLSAALADGLCLWIAMLHATSVITAWDMCPSDQSQDAVKVTLAIGDPCDALVQFIVRKHQVALVGIDCVAALLVTLAPRIIAAQSH